MNEAMNSQIYNSFDVAMPLDSARNARLVFASGAAGVSLQADPALPDLFQAHFEGHIPSVRVQAGVVSIQYRRCSFLDRRDSLAEVTLNGSLPWEIEFRDSVSKLIADLRGLALRSLDLSSASQGMIRLPQPSGAVYIHVSGSISDLSLYRPPGVAARVYLSSSASYLTFDQQHFGAVAGEMRWQTPDYESTPDHYDISIAGSARNVTIGAR